MRIIKLLIFAVILILAIVGNIYYLKYSWFIFVGLFLTLWLVYGFFSNFIIKFYKNKRGIPQEKYAYAFPDKLAKAMKKVDMRTQLESALLSMSFILVGMAAFDIYIVFFMNVGWWFKGLALFNSFWGFVFLFTSLVGQYQSYVTYMQTIESLKSNTMEETTLQLNSELMKGG